MDKSYKRKNYYQAKTGPSSWNNKKKFKNYLQPGMKGFLCTCNSREKDCIKESYNILCEYADELYGSDNIERKESVEVKDEASGDFEGDIEDELQKEVTSLKKGQWTPGRFSTVDTGVRANVFIKTTLENPVEIAHTILSDIAKTKTQKARFLLRLVPVEVTCKANLEDIKTAANLLFDKHFRCEPTTFAVVINKRYNDSILRDDVIHSLALLVTDKNREHKADLKDAKFTVLVEIMKGVCCLSVLKDYKKLRHYNIAELAKPELDKLTMEEKNAEISNNTSENEEKSNFENEPGDTKNQRFTNAVSEEIKDLSENNITELCGNKADIEIDLMEANKGIEESSAPDVSGI